MKRVMNKSGVSAVVATVLIIMITVAAVGIVWAVVIPMIKDSLGGSAVCNDVDISIGTTQGYTCYDSAQKVVAVQVVKGANNLVVSGLKFTVSSGGNSVSYSTDFSFVKSASKVFYINVSKLNSVEEIGLIPVLVDGKSSKECTKVGLNIIPSCSLGEVEVINVVEENEEGDTLLTACQEISKSGTYVLQNDVSSEGTCFTITANNVILNGNGFTIEGDGVGDDRGVYINGVSGVNVTGFAGITYFGIGIYDNYGGNYITSNTIAYNSYEGIWITNTASGSDTISGNTIEYNIYNGIIIEAGSHTIDASTSANIIRGNSESGIYINSGNATISGNTIGENGYSQKFGISDKYGGSTITSNTIAYNSWEGIYLSGNSGTTTVSGNTIQYNTYDGIYIYNSYSIIDASTSANIIRGNGVGITLETATATISGNTIGERGYTQGSGIFDLYGGSTITSNTIDSDSKGIQIGGGSGNTISGNTITSYYDTAVLFSAASENSIINSNTINSGTSGTCSDSTYFCSGIAYASTSTGDTIDGNVFNLDGPFSIGVYFYSGSSNDIIYSNTFSGNPNNYAIFAGSTNINNNISGNNINLPNGAGIYSPGSNNNIITENIISGFYQALIGSFSNSVISLNTLVSTNYDSFELSSSLNNIINSNTINSGTLGCNDVNNAYSCSGIVYTSSSTNDLIEENTIHTYGHGVYYSEAPAGNSFSGNSIFFGSGYFNVSLVGNQY